MIIKKHKDIPAVVVDDWYTPEELNLILENWLKEV